MWHAHLARVFTGGTPVPRQTAEAPSLELPQANSNPQPIAAMAAVP